MRQVILRVSMDETIKNFLFCQAGVLLLFTIFSFVEVAGDGTSHHIVQQFKAQSFYGCVVYKMKKTAAFFFQIGYELPQPVQTVI